MARVKFTWGPGNSARSCNAKAAHARIVKFAVSRAAEELAMKASAKLAEHHHDGDAKITTTHGGLDWFVNLDDSRGQGAAAAIEFGHIAPNGRFVGGIHALTGSLK
jgi:hypothetical protein